MVTRFTLSVAGLRMEFRLPAPAALPEAVLPFLCEETTRPDAVYTVELFTEPMLPEAKPELSSGGMSLYSTDAGWLRVYPSFFDRDGCRVACLLRPGNHQIIYIPAIQWERLSQPFQCLHLIGAEQLLLQHQALLLHSSMVRLHGKAILFSGPSGAGKSTQADLWNQVLGAEILNGDRCVLRLEEDGFRGYGSPWSGTSRIWKQQNAPVAGIFLLKQGPENSLRPVTFEAFSRLLSQCIVNTWDTAFMGGISDLLSHLIDRVPIYVLTCRPDADAVLLAHDTLFGKETAP